MSQHDLSIANQGFPAFRSDLNDALQALGSMQSGTTAPSTTYANMLWYDTTNNIIKMRNEDNDAWISLITLDQTNDIVAAVAATLATFVTLSVTGNTTLGDSSSDTLTVNAKTTFGSEISAPNTFGFKNRIINGAMAVAQRGTSGLTGGTGSLVYTLDRFYFYATGAALTVSQVTGTNFLSNGTCSVLQATGASGNTAFNIGQRIESANIRDLAGGSVAVSFWVYQSTGSTQTVNVTAYTATGGVDNWGSQNTYSNVISASVPNNTWTYVSGTFTLNSTASNGAGISISTTTGTLTNGQTFSIGNVQLEKGSTATSFDYRPYGTELALCQRYYYKFSCDTSAAFGGSFNNSTTLAIGAFGFPVTMRTAPTSLEQTGTAGNYGVDIAGNTLSCSAVPSFAAAGTNSGKVFFTVASGLTAGQGSLIMSRATGSYLGFPAEL